jgi:hypothetical protein
MIIHFLRFAGVRRAFAQPSALATLGRHADSSGPPPRPHKMPIEGLRSYFPRYARVAKLAALDADFAANTPISVIGQYPGTGSTDFWGISFAFSSVDRQDMSSEELARELALMRACWVSFDEVRSRVSAELQQGPRGGGRHRDQIVRHVVRNEQEWAKKHR